MVALMPSQTSFTSPPLHYGRYRCQSSLRRLDYGIHAHITGFFFPWSNIHWHALALRLGYVCRLFSSDCLSMTA
ncbi:hypothetical protein PM082_017492 [Marasmius tenuissimus]|nr:hypothetical protein PM082_017492 [Marasmius tenuissimus]